MKYLVLVIVFLSISISVYGQKEPTAPADTLYRIETNDGNIFIGKLVEISMEKVVIENETMGLITLGRPEIVRIEQIVDYVVILDDVWYRNLQSARYFFAPNGYGLKQGESYYQNTWIFYNQFSGAITDNFSMGVGMVPLFLFAFAPTPVWITPKVSIPIVEDKVNLGAGGLLGYVIGGEAGFGILYGTLTFGGYDKNLTVGAGYAYAGDEFLNSPLINIAGLARVSKKGYLMMENFIVIQNGEMGALSILGGRSMLGKSALDYGLALPLIPDLGEFIAIPWLGITIPFSKNHK